MVNDVNSERSPVLSGVPQVTVLGHLLFLIYISDRPKSVILQICLFADDCVLYSKINDSYHQMAQQRGLSSTQNWRDHCLIPLNITKSKLASFHRRANPMTFNCSFNERFFYGIRYVGVHLNSCHLWNEHINRLI